MHRTSSPTYQPSLGDDWSPSDDEPLDMTNWSYKVIITTIKGIDNPWKLAHLINREGVERGGYEHDSD